MALQHFGGMARASRMGKDPHAETPGKIAGGYAPPISNSFVGKSLAKDVTILTLQIDAGNGRLMNFHAAFDLPQLRQLYKTLQTENMQLYSGASRASKTSHVTLATATMSSWCCWAYVITLWQGSHCQAGITRIPLPGCLSLHNHPTQNNP